MCNNSLLIVVVTFNRIEDLKKCISALRCNKGSFDILIVDNDSTDGTREWLDNQKDVKFIHQNNLGGAGGFYTGMKYMMEKGYEHVVLMDDDGVPDSDEIINLLFYYDKIVKKEGESILNALVVDKLDHLHTSFNWRRGSGRSKVVETLQKQEYFPDIHPFNGTLISRRVIERIGMIKKEMFIWGDEKEYMARAVSNGIGLFTVTSAIHYHPKERGVLGNIIPFVPLYKIVIKPKRFSHHFYRNEAFIYSHYSEKKGKLSMFFWAYTIRFLTHIDFKELWKFWVYFRKGMRNNY